MAQGCRYWPAALDDPAVGAPGDVQAGGRAGLAGLAADPASSVAFGAASRRSVDLAAAPARSRPSRPRPGLRRPTSSTSTASRPTSASASSSRSSRGSLRPGVPDPEHLRAEGDEEGGERQPHADVDEARRAASRPASSSGSRIEDRDDRAVGVERSRRAARPRHVSGREGDRERLDTGDREDDHQDRQRDRLERPVAPERDRSPIAPPATPEEAVTANSVSDLAERDAAEAACRCDSIPAPAASAARMFIRPASSFPSTISRSLRSVISSRMKVRRSFSWAIEAAVKSGAKKSDQGQLEDRRTSRRGCRRTGRGHRTRSPPASRSRIARPSTSRRTADRRKTRAPRKIGPSRGAVSTSRAMMGPANKGIPPDESRRNGRASADGYDSRLR